MPNKEIFKSIIIIIWAYKAYAKSTNPEILIVFFAVIQWVLWEQGLSYRIMYALQSVYSDSQLTHCFGRKGGREWERNNVSKSVFIICNLWSFSILTIFGIGEIIDLCCSQDSLIIRFNLSVFTGFTEYEIVRLPLLHFFSSIIVILYLLLVP